MRLLLVYKMLEWCWWFDCVVFRVQRLIVKCLLKLQFKQCLSCAAAHPGAAHQWDRLE